MSNSRFYYVLALCGHLGLLGLLIVWNVWLYPPTIFPVAIVLLFYIGPLLLPLQGLLHGRLYTHAWVHFLALFYFTVGVMIAAANREERWYAIAQVVLSIMLFMGSMLYVRYRAREQRMNAQNL
ncbi:DUF2069 domain-containing protein [Sulfuriflexus mobilis]|uniref:DUF2069 domain-containing protein n=1 Tax=Sulfuriflexus mobilis TaxID=1811807 RepID=UPI000F84CCD4|nr:DUF2069 domain-containing protein [Sulfuriflexus mobilis]